MSSTGLGGRALGRCSTRALRRREGRQRPALGASGLMACRLVGPRPRHPPLVPAQRGSVVGRAVAAGRGGTRGVRGEGEGGGGLGG